MEYYEKQLRIAQIIYTAMLNEAKKQYSEMADMSFYEMYNKVTEFGEALKKAREDYEYAEQKLAEYKKEHEDDNL